jgi:hypothetical protein
VEFLRHLIAALACAIVLVAAGPAAAATFGVNDDGGKFAADGDPGPFYARLAALGLKQNVFTAHFDPLAPATIANGEQIAAAIAAAQANGVRPVLAVGVTRARLVASNPLFIVQYTEYLRQLVRTYPTVDTIVVGNEPNLTMFWAPQFDSGCREVSGKTFERVLAAAYDTIKAERPDVQVIGLGLSPRGNDRCHAKSNISISPVHFLAGVGAAYRASGRRAPIMDGLSFHPYPQQNTDPVDRGYQYPNAGIPNLDRLKQAFWDAFNGTAQPIFMEGLVPLADGAPRPPRLYLDEVGWQAREPKAFAKAYRGRENVRLVTETSQALTYARLVHRANCDPSVESLDFFHLEDESDRDRWQSGLYRADGTPRPAAIAVRNAVAADDGKCTGKQLFWSHTDGVVGAAANFRPLAVGTLRPGSLAFTATAREEATYTVGIFPTPGWGSKRPEMVRGLALDGVSKAAGGGSIRPYRRVSIRVPQTLAPGTYVFGIRFRARFNPARTRLLVSRAFAVDG